MKTLTFYSYKGGVGRSLALANIATRLTEFNKKICLLDFDLEAPGLHLKFPTLLKTVKIEKGIVDYIFEFSNRGIVPQNIKDFAIECNLGTQNIPSYFIPAGNTELPIYWKKLSSINWYNLLFESENGLKFFLDLKEKIKAEINPDFLLIDSRTGISEMSGITLSLLADEVVVVAANNMENLEGAKKIIKSIGNSESSPLGISPKIHFVLSRIPFTDLPEDKSKEQQLLSQIKNSFSGIYDDEIIILHSDRELEENEQLKIGKDIEDGITSIANDYLKLFGKITRSYLSEDEVKKFANIKEAERLFRIIPHLKTDKERLSFINKAIDLNTKNIDYLLLRSKLHARNINFEDATNDLFKAIALDSKNVDAHVLLAQAFFELKDYKESEYWCNRLLTISENANAYFIKALIIRDTNKSNKEIEYYEKALLLSPNSAIIHYSIANFYKNIREFNNALEYAYKSLELNPKYGLPYLVIGYIKGEMNNYSEMYFNIEQALLNKSSSVIEVLLNDKNFKKYMAEDKFKKLLEKYNIILANSNE